MLFFRHVHLFSPRLVSGAFRARDRQALFQPDVIRGPQIFKTREDTSTLTVLQVAAGE